MSKAYHDVNRVKADFDKVYTASTPHAYLSLMSRYDYEITDQAQPYCLAAARLMGQTNGHPSGVNILDIGCSYGIGSVMIKYGRSFRDLVAFVTEKMPTEYDDAVAAIRDWLNSDHPASEIRSVGVDSSHAAIRFASDSGILDHGIARDFEHTDSSLNEEECAAIRSCNLLICTGAIGYLTDRTLDVILEDFGTEMKGQRGPFAVLTILRMFDVAPIQACFNKHGYEFAGVRDVLLPQRSFTCTKEREQVLAILRERGLNTSDLEDQGKHFANLCIAAPEGQLADLYRAMKAARS